MVKFALREKCPNAEFFLVRIQENTDQKKPRFGHFSLSVVPSKMVVVQIIARLVYYEQKQPPDVFYEKRCS